MSFEPTIEQKYSVKAVHENGLVKIEAVAGSGKTATLELVTKYIKLPTLYMAFNRAMADEAARKFGSNVICKSVHSVAYGQVGHLYREKLSRPSGGYVNVAGTPAEIARFYNLRGGFFFGKSLFAKWVMNTVKQFEQSAEMELSSVHVTKHDINKTIKKFEEKNQTKLKGMLEKVSKEVLMYAKRLWKDRIDLNTEVLANHDTYLKLFQLQKPKLNYQMIMLDEAQDANPVIIDLVLNQTEHAKVVLVGDRYQQIYAWRGAINALEQVEAVSKGLTKSFRFGPEVANVANHILDKHEFVKGFEQLDTKVGSIDPEQPYTRLYRTNAALLSDAVGYITHGESVRLEIDTAAFVRKLKSVLALFEGDTKQVKDPEIIGFNDFNEFMEDAEDNPELLRLGNLVKENEAKHVLDVLDKFKNPHKAHITLTTAHKAKGREFEQVQLCDDFVAGVDYPMNDAERNLLYVAATRATMKLELNLVASMCLSGTVDRGYDDV